MKFLHISDLHYTQEIKERGGAFHEVLKITDKPFDQLNALNINPKAYDFILVSGDLCEEGTVFEYRSLKNELESYFNCPIIMTAGNHDDIASFKEAYGSLFFVHMIGNYRIISFNSASSIDENGMIEDETIDELEKALAQKWVGKTILMTHHHLLEEQFQMPCAKYSKRLIEVIEKSDVDLILTGHTHHFYKATFANKPYYTSGSLSFVAEAEDAHLSIYIAPSVIEFEDNEEILHRVISSTIKKHIHTL